MEKYIVALDQGTTSSRAIIFDKEQNILEIAQKEITPIYLKKDGWSKILWRYMHLSMGF